MPKFRKKPVVIEAVQFDGENQVEIREFVDFPLRGLHEPRILWIETLEGRMQANVGDWIIRGVKGEFYPCKPDIFDATYEPSAGGSTDGAGTVADHIAIFDGPPLEGRGTP